VRRFEEKYQTTLTQLDTDGLPEQADFEMHEDYMWSNGKATTWNIEAKGWPCSVSQFRHGRRFLTFTGKCWIIYPA
jgi:hypothetical protein